MCAIPVTHSYEPMNYDAMSWDLVGLSPVCIYGNEMPGNYAAV